MRLIEYTQQLSAKGQYHFTADEARTVLKVSRTALNMALLRLREKGSLASPAKHFYLIIPPEYQSIGCLPPDHFIPYLMQYWDLPYYVALLSAAEYYGAAHQRPQQFQVMTSIHKHKVQCGQIQISFIRKKDLTETPLKTFHTPRSMIAVSTPEATVVDLLNYPWQSGGLNHIATILSELKEAVEPNALVELARKSRSSAWIQRLGYLLKCIGDKELSSLLLMELKNKKTRLIPLDPDLSMKGCEHDVDWRVAINMNVESDV